LIKIYLTRRKSLEIPKGQSEPALGGMGVRSL
jgi:hypothetical protein